jgi:twitching motility protein PilJ
MSISLPNFNILSGRNAKSSKDERQTTLIMGNLRKLADREPGNVPLIGKLPIDKQYLYSAVTLVSSLVLMGVMIVWGAVQSNNQGKYLDRSSNMGMLSQRLPTLAQLALQGNQDAFENLAAGKVSFETNLMGLKNGDSQVPASPAAAQAILDRIQTTWSTFPKDIGSILDGKETLVKLNGGIRKINLLSNDLQTSTEKLTNLLIQINASTSLINKSSQLSVLSQRMAKNANTLLTSSTVDPKVTQQLEKDTSNFHQLVDTLTQSSVIGNMDVANQLEQVGERTGDLIEAVGYVLGNIQPLVNAKLGTRDMFSKSEALLQNTTALGKSYGSHWLLSYAVAGVLSVIALGSLILLGMININETKTRARKSEKENQRNQEAILRLMDELGQLSEGDLTMQATVSESITGAIADSINFTVDELRSLVRGINNATTQLDKAAHEANEVSNQLQQATQRQTREIENTSQSVVEISQSIQQVSNNAAESARVAKQSLAAAEKGQQAVQNSISGMNALREQIQETSKRIKRLGESSQEIGEIVELISDITEQTNVLALNAAIQAASAGEAGRGFSVVAEEVQRLAERSSEATKQIAAIVRTIQADTHDTVAAMEISTQGVVEGARLSDAAGQTLQEIGAVSQKLAGLIEDISRATHNQADATAKVAETMQDIKNITMQTSKNTQQTAQSIGGLSRLAEELKSSISGFKLK